MAGKAAISRMSSYLNLQKSLSACRITGCVRMHSTDKKSGSEIKKGKTPLGRLDDKWEAPREKMEPQKRPFVSEEDAYKRFPDDTNPETGEIGGPRGPEPTRYGDWERKGRVIDF